MKNEFGGGGGRILTPVKVVEFCHGFKCRHDLMQVGQI